jgi:hypothetical protein
MTRVLFFAALVGLIGCESDETKLTRLGADKAGSCIEADMARNHIGLSDPTTDSAGWRRFGEAQTRCELATRAYDKFMDGR